MSGFSIFFPVTNIPLSPPKLSVGSELTEQTDSRSLLFRRQSAVCSFLEADVATCRAKIALRRSQCDLVLGRVVPQGTYGIVTGELQENRNDRELQRPTTFKARGLETPLKSLPLHHQPPIRGGYFPADRIQTGGQSKIVNILDVRQGR